MKHLFLITINPVQSFIEQARKVHDLAAGSDMLSYFMKEIADFISKNDLKPVQLFPHKDTKAYPHRLLFDFNTDNSDKVKQIGIDTEKHFEEFLNNATENYLKNKINQDSFEIAKKQIQQVFKLYWVALVYNENNFKEKYLEIDKLLGSVKNIRPFVQFPEKGRKCSLNGEYNVVAYRYKDDKEEQKDKDLIRTQVKNHKHEQKRVVKWLEYTSNVTCIGENSRVDLRKISQGEALSGISFLKRNWKLTNGLRSFDATCEIAYLDAVQRLSQNPDTEKTIKELQKIDEQYLYDDAGISDNHKNKKTDIAKLQKQISEAKVQYNKDNKTKLKFGKYYAVLMFDADTMGKWLSGEKLKTDINLKAFQDKLSGNLVRFAEVAEKYVNGDEKQTKKGQVIYAGGDDFLALIGLEHLFDVINHLRERFKEIINSDDINSFKNVDEEITFSAGIAIAHYKTPLSYVLGEARKAEHTAKEDGDRNAFAITVLKRSGEIKQAYQKFGKNNCNLKILAELLTQRQTGKVTRSFINHFAKEFQPLIENNEVDEFDSNEPIKKEFKRLLKNSMPQKENYSNEYAENLFSLIEFENGDNILNFIDLLFIIDFVSREINEPIKAEDYAS